MTTIGFAVYGSNAPEMPNKPQYGLFNGAIGIHDIFETEMLAREAARNYYHFHQTRKEQWPLRIVLFSNEKRTGVFEVNYKLIPEFSACKIHENAG